jgi:type IV secretion system protein VirB8
MQVSNPESPLTLYPRTTVIDARVKSVSPIGANASLVRFDTFRQDARGQRQLAGSWVGIVRYRYSSAPMPLEDRFVNPLGFQVTSYRRDPEALPAVGAEPATEAAQAQPASSAPAPQYYPAAPAPRTPAGATK